GKLAYWHGGFQQLGRRTPRFSIQVNGTTRLASFALLTRVRNYGGDFEIARRIRLTDGDFEVVMFENHEWHDYLRFFGAVVTNRLYQTPGGVIERASEAILRSADNEPGDDRIYVQMDGESAGNVPATISTVPDSLTLLIPKTYLEG